MTKHFLSIADFTAPEMWEVLLLASQLKKELKETGKNEPLLDKKTLVMIFEKPSLRTRLSFETGMTQLGGHAVYLSPSDISMGERESISDVAAVTSGMGNILMARTFKHKTIEKLASYSLTPVINGLSDLEHPCQILSDFLTIWEEKKRLSDLTIAYVGDGENNIAHSLCLGSAVLGITFTCASPEGYSLRPQVVAKAKKIAETTKAQIYETHNAEEAVEGADIVYTDTWVSMGDEKETKKRLAVFPPFQVSKKLMKLAKHDAIFMHDLPAYRGQEVTEEVIDGPQSVVFDQAENRLHAQKALLLNVLGVL